MQLTREEQDILAGKRGEAERLSMAIIVELGELFGAEELIPISQVHIDTTIYMVDAGVEFIEKLAGLGAKFSVPTQLNPSAIDLLHPEKSRVTPTLLDKCKRIEKAYLAMGAIPSWTCAPYQQGLVPRFGEQIGWGESNAIAFANSVLGARTNRYADLMDICMAIVGRAPRFGLHLTENRRAEILVRLEGITEEMFADDSIYPVMGFLFGELAGNRIAALEGVPADVSIDHLKSFSAAAASSGAVGLFHIIGVTPEAQTEQACFQDRAPVAVLTITPDRLREAEERLSTAKGEGLDLVVLGCPHCSAAEVQQVAALLEGRRISSGVKLWIITSRAVYSWMEQCGVLDILEGAGATLFSDACPLQYPRERWDFTVAMSNSAKFANYCFSQTGLDVVIGSTRACIQSALTGKRQRGSLW
ncbi:MAG: hypothetical protein CR981_00770 [Proteobacteria bacterium]|nr:MAG: hypothetical protein CR981_00770 [Pseudomonadota bacterium]PIE65242.1 MAG: hypothetical protein CSA26_04000 [Desulfobacterales bacterium]